MANTYIQIGSTVTVGSGGAATIAFTSIPATYTDLKVVLSLKATGARAEDALLVRFNSDSTAANYTIRWIRGNGSAVTVGDGAGFAGGYVGEFNGGTSTTSTFTSEEIYVPNYAGTNKKSFSSDITQEANQTLAYAHLVAGLWSGTAAITNITFIDHNGNDFAQYSTASLYGIKSS
jgi:hypothetical protein